MSEFFKTNFEGGLDGSIDVAKMSADSYPLLINGENRDGSISPVKAPLLDDEGLAEGNYQCLFITGGRVFIVIQGLVYARDYAAGETSFTSLSPHVTLQSNATKVWAEEVPASAIQYLRKAGDTPDAATTLDSSVVNGSKSGVIFQDGLSQPVFVDSDNVIRRLNRFSDWSIENREYVPVGKQMKFIDDILYVVRPDGRALFRSVKGRPLDFVIAIDGDGGVTSELINGAEATEIPVSLESITAIQPLPTENGDFVVCTPNQSYLYTPNYSTTVFGQPTYLRRILFNVGAINQESMVEFLGDQILVTSGGIRSFNAMLQLKNENRNTIFSRRIRKFLKDIVQDIDTTCVAVIDEFLYVSMETTRGSVLVAYDGAKGIYMGFHQFLNVGKFKFIRTFNFGSRVRIFGITVDNRFYELFAGTRSEQCQLFVGDFTGPSPKLKTSVDTVHLSFSDVRGPGVVFVQGREDGKSKLDMACMTVVEDSIIEDDDFGYKGLARSVKLSNSVVANRVGFKVAWDFDASLSAFAFTGETNPDPSVKEATRYFGEIGATAYKVYGNSMSFNEQDRITIIGDSMYDVEHVYLGITRIEALDISADGKSLSFTVPIGCTSGYLTLFSGKRVVYAKNLGYFTITTL